MADRYLSFLSENKIETKSVVAQLLLSVTHDQSAQTLTNEICLIFEGEGHKGHKDLS